MALVAATSGRDEEAPMSADRARKPRMVVVGLASCFGCQINLTNAETHLMDILSQVDVEHWQLTSSDPMPEDFDIAVIEGAVTTKEAIETVKALREIADTVITIGACANTGGIPGLAAEGAGYEERIAAVYGATMPAACGTMVAPSAVGEHIAVDYEVTCCPVEPLDFARVLQHALYGSNVQRLTATLCGECKRNERGCFYEDGTLCLGLVTRCGCGARCPSLGRPCKGCAGLSVDANLKGARAISAGCGISSERFEEVLRIFNHGDGAKASSEREG